MNKRKNICIVSFIIGKAFQVPLNDLERVVNAVEHDPYLVIAHTKEIESRKALGNQRRKEFVYQAPSFLLARFLMYLWLQIKISYELAKLTNEVDYFLFFMEASPVLPMMVAKLAGKTVVWVLPSQIVGTSSENLVPSKKLFNIIRRCCYFLADSIVIYSPRLTSEWKLENYRSKLRIASQHYIDLSIFRVEKQIENRSSLVGYIGRLSAEKGILNFLESIPILLKERNDVNFLIAGSGQLTEEVKKHLARENLLSKVVFTEWIPHNELKEYFNRIRLLVMPSYTEGLPNILLEAMACGTPVLATMVGAMPDIIKDGKTGFIMESNSPQCIARNILRALRYPDLNIISEEARAFVENEFTFEKAVKKYQHILS
jgi:glycosyltransferase involved in cell wall biosynthesis